MADLGNDTSIAKVRNFYRNDDLEVYDYIIDVYHGQAGEKENYKKSLHFFVLSQRLPRQLPNVFFDSKATGKKEFAKLFHKSQRHSLEGNFDDYFTTYFSEHYIIDNLSFITPEVMQAMIDASAYDIEIYDDRLLLYNELENMPDQLQDAITKADKVRQTLLNNIQSYRDDRLPYKLGRHYVHISGMRLRRNLLWSYIKIAFGVTVFIYGLLSIPAVNDLLSSLGILLLATIPIRSGWTKITKERGH